MSETKRRAVGIVLAHGLELVDADGAPIAPRRTVRRAEVPELDALRAKCAGGVEPLFASELGLTVSPRSPPSLSEAELAENGARVLAAVRAAVASKDLGRLRKLCAWFVFPTLYMREVHDCLDSLPRERAEQIAGLLPGQGRPHQPYEQLGLIATMDLLVEQKGVRAAKAAKRLAEVPGVWLSELGLKNLKSKLGPLARCLRGYVIPPGETGWRWREKPDDELAVYVVNGREPHDE